MTNLILTTDSYKASHFLQYPRGTEYINSYIEPRRSSISGNVVHFGLQIFLNNYLSKPVTIADIEEAEDFFALHGEPFNREGWQYIVDKHGGYIPVVIESIPEGTVIPLRNVQVQARNTDPKVPWITNYIETALLRAVWYGSSVATVSREAKRIIKRYLDLTCDNPDAEIPFKLHDFGARGASSAETAGIGGAAHLVNFMGSDTVEGILTARRHYGITMAGFSIPAAEHSTIMAWPNEESAFANMIDKFSGDGRLYAVVSDTYDIHNAVNHIWGERLQNLVKVRGGTLVVRPDSGEPAVIVLAVVTGLAEKFGYTVNTKGYKVLDKSVRVIQGDGVTLQSIPGILETLLQAGFSTENVAFGMGAGLLQNVNRDSFGYAMKASAICQDGKWRDIRKNPVTDQGKASKGGILELVRQGGVIRTITQAEASGWVDDRVRMLVPVYEDGDILKTWTMVEVRENVKL
jgi:nicotinamide phosphoribosyltransferase